MNDARADADTSAVRHPSSHHQAATATPHPGPGPATRSDAVDFDAQQRQFRHLWSLLERVSQGNSLEEILSFIYEGFRGEIPFDRIAFATVDDPTGRVVARWARSEKGLRIAPGYSQELDRSSLAHLSRAGQPRIIDDLEAYLAEHPDSDGTARLLAEDLRSSLTCPLVVEGRTIGFLFFNSSRTHAYSDVHVSFFVRLSAILAGLVERARLFDELTEQKATVENQGRLLAEENRRHREELALAQTVQRALIRGRFPARCRLRSEMLYEPATMVGGDLVDCIGLGDHGGLVYVADALGHGVPAALVMGVVRTAFHGALAAQTDPRHPSPAALLDEVNGTLVEMLDRQYVTAACARVDSEMRTVTLALAGHPPVFLLRRASGEVENVPARAIPLGIYATTTYADVQVPFSDGDVLLFYTDGVVEAEDASGNAFGRDRLRSMLGGAGADPIETILTGIRAALRHHTEGVALEDDITLLAVQL